MTGIVVVLAAAGLWRVTATGPGTPQYQTATVERGTVIATKTETGNVEAQDQVSVGSPVDGVIEQVFVKNGDSVTAGQNLFRVKATATPQQQAAAYASYLNAADSAKTSQAAKMTAQAALEKDRQAVIDASNTRTIMQDNLNISYPNPATKLPYTQDEIDSIKSAYTSALETFSADERKYLDADAAITAAQSQANSQWLAYRATQDQVVTAPVSGTIANLAVVAGTNVTASNGGTNQQGSSSSSTSTSGAAGQTSSVTSSAGSSVLLIGNYSGLTVTAQVTEADVPSIRVGQNVTVTLDAFPGKTFAGKVASADTVGTSNSGVVQYAVRIGLESPPPGVLPGMSASAVIQTDRHDNVLSVPNAAIQTVGGQSAVRVLANGRVTQVPVETGLTTDTVTEIVSGLSEGQTVVTGGGAPSSSSTQPAGRSPFSGGFGGFGRGGR